MKQISVNGTYCGITSGQYQGDISTTVGATTIHGYAAAKLLCEQVAACAKPYAHMCSAEEMSRSAQLGLFLSVATNIGPFWINGAGTITTDNVSKVGNDCDGWVRTDSQQQIGIRIRNGFELCERHRPELRGVGGHRLLPVGAMAPRAAD